MQEETNPSVLEFCRLSETKLGEVQRLLLDPRPEALNRCRTELREVMVMLEGLVSGGSLQQNPAVSSSLRQIRHAAQALRLQMEHASNLCLGWIQLRFGTGYSERGLPVLATAEARRSFEA